MALPPKLSDSVRRVFPRDSAEGMVTWMEEVESRHSEAAQLRADFGALRGEFGELRTEFGEIRTEFAELRTELAEFRDTMRGELASLRLEIKEAKYDLIKWSFLFWVGAVMSIAVLAGVLRSFP